MSADEVQDMYKLRFDDANKFVYMLPQDVIDETIKAFSVSATSASGYGTGGAPSGRYFASGQRPGLHRGRQRRRRLRHAATSSSPGPMFQQHDISIAKKVRLVGRTDFEFRAEMLNAFNHVNFMPVGGIGNAIANYRVTGLTGTNTAASCSSWPGSTSNESEAEAGSEKELPAVKQLPAVVTGGPLLDSLRLSSSTQIRLQLTR